MGNFAAAADVEAVVNDRSGLRRARFEAMYSQHYGAVWAYARRRVASAADADDVAAQTWVSVWLRLDDVPDGNELAWCYGTARRCVANHRRGEGRRLRLQHVVAHERRDEARRDSSPDPRTDQLRAALELLHDDDRELLRLVAWEQLTHAEISVALGVTSNTVSVRLHRAKRRLARALQDLDSAGHMSGTAPKGTS
jgi:RNA polymerase sigma-70 factor (ECF subfamily)